MSDNLITEKIKDFWKYASTLKGTHDIEDVFIDWTTVNSNITINELKGIWEGINTDIRTAFDAKDIESLTNLIQTVMQSNQGAEAPISMEDVSEELGVDLGAMDEEPGLEMPAEAPAAEAPAASAPATETESVLKQMAGSGGQAETPPEIDTKPPGEEKKDDRELMLTESLLL